jgi:hypothetical protein
VEAKKNDDPLDIKKKRFLRKKQVLDLWNMVLPQINKFLRKKRLA